MFEKLAKLIARASGIEDFQLGAPEFEELGHFTSSVAFSVAKRDKTSPIQAAELIRGRILDESPKGFIRQIDIKAPGFINFWMTDHALQEEFSGIRHKGDKYGKLDVGKGKRVIVEYSSPNIAKPMHVGHMRSTIIGAAIANIHEELGYKVVRWNYLGDWGTQFGKLIAAYKKWGDKKEVERAPIETLLTLYVKFNEEAKKDAELEKSGREEFKKLEDGDKENRRLWTWFRKESLKDLQPIYKTLGVKFDVLIGESFYEKDLEPLIRDLGNKGMLKLSEGALIIPLDSFNLPPALLKKSDGASLYITREIANLIYRLNKYKPKKIIYVVGYEQSLHFEQLSALAQLLNLSSAEIVHVKYGMVTGEGGKKISTREGSSIALEDLIEESLIRARKIIDIKQPSLSDRDKDKIARLVGIAALKYNDLSQSRMSDISFDWDKMLNFEGNSAPYLLYAYARMRSILNKASHNKADSNFLSSKEDLALILKLSRFPQVIQRAADGGFPHYIAGYLYELAKTVNRFYENEPVLKAGKGVREARLGLVDAAAKVMKNGLGLLGIEVSEKM
jgi:arginyl-tRNA synthetase